MTANEKKIARAGPELPAPALKLSDLVSAGGTWAVRAGLLAAALFALGAPQVQAAEWYAAGGLGANLADAIGLATTDTDRASYCDEYVNPQYAQISNCTAPNRGSGAVDAWTSGFDEASGRFANLAVGVEAGERWRIELEYFYRRAGIDQTAPIISPSGTAYTEIFGAELPRAEDRLDRLSAQNLFANVYLRLPSGGNLTPFIGLGAGLGRISLRHSALWRRSDDPADIASVANAVAQGLSPEAAEILRGNLAGTESITQRDLRDSLYGAQLLVGVEYALSRSLALTLTARRTQFRELSGGGDYRELRSHPSNLRRDGSEPVTYSVEADGLSFNAISLGLTYRFGGGNRAR